MQRALLMALIGLFILALAAPYAAADTTRTLRVDFSPSPGQRFGVENLAGVMTVVAGSGDRVVATATVHAGSEALAGMMRFERVRGEKGEPVLRVIYPVDEHRRYRYPGGGTSGSSWFGLFGGSNSSTRYDGRKVKVTSSGGVELYADVEVRMPAGEYAAWFRNVVGDLSARGVQGDLEFDTSSGKIDLEELRGIISADTGSGEIEAREMEGSFSGDTGSGSVYLIGFEGESLSCDTGSGSISMEDIRTDRLDADTGSGSISVRGGSARIVKADTGSGRITHGSRRHLPRHGRPGERDDPEPVRRRPAHHQGPRGGRIPSGRREDPDLLRHGQRQPDPRAGAVSRPEGDPALPRPPFRGSIP
jgi:hypothetical protein